MPELPEVETVRRSLAPIIGAKIGAIDVRDQRLRYPVQTEVLKKVLVGKQVKALKRRSKYLVVEMSDGGWLIIHLGMSGRLYLDDPKAEQEKHLHVIFSLKTLDGGRELRFVDPRRFGLVEAVPADQTSHYGRFQHLGVEPLSAVFDAEYLFAQTRKSERAIKTLLMDQTKVVGIGNIYASEALFLASIHPLTKAGNLTRVQADKLVLACKQTLKEAIRQGGTTLNDFQSSDRKRGYFQVYLRVYGRENEPCVQCGKAVKKVVLMNRSTFFCGSCQKRR